MPGVGGVRRCRTGASSTVHFMTRAPVRSLTQVPVSAIRAHLLPCKPRGRACRTGAGVAAELGHAPHRRLARPGVNPGNLGTLTGGPARMISRVRVMAGGGGHRAGRVSGAGHVGMMTWPVVRCP